MHIINLFFKEKKKFVFFSLTFGMLITLGTWQLYRLNEKNIYTETIFKNTSLPSKKVESYDPNLALYSKISLEGEILLEKAMWLYRRHGGAKYQEGAYLIVPIEDKYKNIFLAIIGWVQQENQDKILKEIADSKKINLTGLLLFSEQNSMFIPKNDYSHKICFTMDIEDIGKSLGLNLYKYSLAILDANNKFTTPMLTITPEMMIKIKNDHLEYAATWYGLAIVLCCIYYIYLKKKYIAKSL